MFAGLRALAADDVAAPSGLDQNVAESCGRIRCGRRAEHETVAVISIIRPRLIRLVVASSISAPTARHIPADVESDSVALYKNHVPEPQQAARAALPYEPRAPQPLYALFTDI